MNLAVLLPLLYFKIGPFSRLTLFNFSIVRWGRTVPIVQCVEAKGVSGVGSGKLNGLVRAGFSQRRGVHRVVVRSSASRMENAEADLEVHRYRSCSDDR
jgi:hypothetical protein